MTADGLVVPQDSEVKVYLPLTLPTGPLCIGLLQPRWRSDTGQEEVSALYNPEGSPTEWKTRTAQLSQPTGQQEMVGRQGEITLSLTEAATKVVRERWKLV